MTDIERIAFLKKEPPSPCCLADYYLNLLEVIGTFKRNYGDYLIISPINCDEELKRIDSADYELCCALLTMLIREDHFMQYGCFKDRFEKGDVQRIIERMIFLLESRI